ncbi:MAG: Xaa-Pro peptidase family protein [Thermoanaerobaculales bacterium]|nr:Xaa-Pro peptidase family protein [Thermoanaerobaculales bacterium]
MEQRDMRGGNYAAAVQTPDVYKGRRRRLAESVGEGTIVVWGNGDDRGAGDVGTFRQDSIFFYLTGVELPNAVTVIRQTDKGDLLFLPPRDEDVERWTGPKWGPGAGAASALGFDDVLSIAPGQTVLDARIRPVPGFEGRLQAWLSGSNGILWTIFPSLSSSTDLPVTHRAISRLRDRTPTFSVRDLSDEIATLRMVKDNGEVGLMRRAIEATVVGHRAAAKAIRPGIGEGVVDGVIYSAFRASGAEGLAFPTIVGSGFNATTLHYDQNVDVCSDGELVVVDIGARFGYYCGDITRTYPVNGRFTDRQRDLYDLVLEAHDRVAEAIKPGITIFDLRKIAYGVFQDSPLRDDKSERLGQYFIHGLGHFLGLDAHDPGGDAVILEPGMVITNEPGLYLPAEATGIRIENDHLVTAYGNENLSSALPTKADEVEAMMAAG